MSHDVLAANAAFYAAFAAGDIDAMNAIWSRDPAVTCIHPGYDVLHGRAAVMASWRSILGGEDNPIVATDARAHVNGDSAYVTCLEGLRGDPASLVATNVFARDGGEWKMVHHQAGPLGRPRAAPPPTTPTRGVN